MHVLQVGESLAVEYGGTAAACAELTNQLAHCGVDVSLITLGGSNGSGPTFPLDPAVAATVCMPAAPRRLGYCPGIPEILESLAPQDLVHVHGLWRLHYLQSAQFARARSIPVIVSVHGMLLGGALRQRSFIRAAGRRRRNNPGGRHV